MESMIIVEERLTEVFDQLPLIQGFKPVYKWGNEFHLIAQLKSFADAGVSPYPLIYQDISEEETQRVLGDQTTLNLRFVIATSNPATELLNENRWAMSYRNILFPLVENIEKAMLRAGIFTWDSQYKLAKFPNYGNGEQNKTTEIWDALVITLNNVIINSNCVSTINFN